ncbi:hypothetical protein ACVDG5_018985 [Mesorhizobium sp. ORM6]
MLTPTAAAMSALVPARQRIVSQGVVLAPMPGLFREMLVAAGDEISAGQDIAIMDHGSNENESDDSHDTFRSCNKGLRQGMRYVSASLPLFAIEL